MPLIQSDSQLNAIFETLPSNVVWHLTVLRCALSAFQMAQLETSEGRYGSEEAAAVILGLLGFDYPFDLRTDYSGVRLKDVLFKPLCADLSPLQEAYYAGALAASEHNMRSVADTQPYSDSLDQAPSSINLTVSPGI